MKTPRTTNEPEVDVPEEAPLKVELHDAGGHEIGVTVSLKEDSSPDEDSPPDEEPELARLRRLSKRIAGWTSLTLDGDPYPFSQARAVALFTRFSHFAAQIERALPKDSK